MCLRVQQQWETSHCWSKQTEPAAGAKNTHTLHAVRAGTLTHTPRHAVILILGYLGRWDCSVLPWQPG